jgi:hypothetical protein
MRSTLWRDVATPHDLLCEAIYGEPELTRGARRTLVPATFAEELDGPKLAPCTDGFFVRVPSKHHTKLPFSSLAFAPRTIVTAREKLLQQGLELGFQLGFEIGFQFGYRREGQRILLRLLRQRFPGAVDAEVEQRIAVAPLMQLEAWTDRVLTAATVHELLAPVAPHEG